MSKTNVTYNFKGSFTQGSTHIGYKFISYNNTSSLIVSLKAPMEAERETSLHATIANLIPHFKARLDQIKKHHSHVKLHPHTVQNIISGSRSIKSILWDISMLDAETDPKQQCTALLALLNLAIGNET